MQHYPSITALRAFEAVARLGSVTSAAREMNLTRSAISRQIAGLEESLGFPLTYRSGRNIGLTIQGQRYAGEVRRSLQILQAAARWESGPDITGRLIISCIPGLATYWLCHHIGEFQRLFPKLELDLRSPRTPDDTSNEDVDLFISYGDGHWPDMNVRRFMTLQLFPICSPQFLNRTEGLKSPTDLPNFTLLHLANQTNWRVWLAAVGAQNAQLQGGITFSDAHFVQSAAIAGQGIALGDNMLSGDALARGLVVMPFDISIDAPKAYYFVTSPEKTDRPDVQAFVRWLEDKFAAEQRNWRRKGAGIIG
ncbi:LysR substrate-binding domain-containing protein [Marinobacterium mangrovicola]|uniref:LysR family glycine cleavage system transcriptional activator n=1 Tax=Marinobacterium mangrovicola TaxID=1476959 RepID=A0A4R1GD95_9GAMM|nr:LysR substrate-binding domain-containing protein [Marinobacterium mangrovicola]TCK04770.1 LysR family glycine cleavage system transcriptional activator [Marinobacterium mangrovicola]